MSPPLGLIGSATADLDLAVLDGLPRLARAGEPDVVDGEVLAGREAVVHLEAVDVVEGDVCAAEGVEHGTAHVGQHVFGGVVPRTVELLSQAEADGAVAPAVDPAEGPGTRGDRAASRR